MKRAYDVVVWGSTGFTGQLVAEYLATIVGSTRFPSFSYAIAGRNQSKLETLQESIASGTGGRVRPDILVGDATAVDTVHSVVKQARVVICTAGPFLQYSVPVAEACVENGCHYVDISGETPYAKCLIDKLHRKAFEKGLVVSPMCGFDSIPSDLGTLFAVDELKKQTQSPCRKVTGYCALSGSFSGGTVATGIMIDSDPKLKRMAADPFLLGGCPAGGIREHDEDVRAAQFDDAVGCWTGPFMMAPINTRAVRRSHGLYAEAYPPGYGPNFSYNEVQLADSERRAKALVRILSSTAEERKQMVQAGMLPSPGQGPSEEKRAKSRFRFVLRAEAEDGTVVNTLVAGGDPGYGETAKMVSESALTILQHEATIVQEARTGVVPPAFSLGHRLIANLVAQGIEFKVIDNTAKLSPKL